MEKNVFGNHPDTTTKALSPIGGNSLATALVALSTPNPLSPARWVDTKLTERLKQNAIYEANHEQLRALLAKSSLDNAAALSALEAHLCNAAPLGEERYKTIVNAYALSAAMRIARW